MNVKISSLIEKFQNGSSECVMEILQIFRPLFNKYGRLLIYEDASQDLEVALIASLAKIDMRGLSSKNDSVMGSYIQAIIYHEYISLSVKHKEWKNNAVLIENMDDLPTKGQRASPCHTNDFKNQIFYDISKYLTELESDIIVMVYWHGYTVRDISNARRISRQAVNCTKQRALRKLRQHYERD